MKLAKEETLLKEWEYAETTVKGQKSISKLTVTNKRIVADTRGMGKVERQEIPMSAVKGVSCSYERSAPRRGLVRIILSALFIILGIVLFVQGIDMDEISLLLVSILIIMIGIFLLGIKTRSGFILAITTYGEEGSPLALGASNLTGKNKAVATTAQIQVQVKDLVVMDMIETIGAIITENQKA